MRVAVVILNWNARQLLETYLPSVLANLPDYAELIIADNDSTDDSLAYLSEHHPNIRIIRNPENGGFALGYNQALQQVDAEYYVLLNSDVEVTERWIEPMVTYLDAHPEVVACQPKVRSHAIPDEFEYSGAAGGYIDHLGYPFCRGRLLNSMEKDSGQYDDAVEVFWATGACLFIRSEAFHALGGFDADFFAHMEEIDLCWRLRNRGHKIMVLPASTVFHLGGAIIKYGSPAKVYRNHRNNLIMLIKNLPLGALRWKLPLRFLLDYIAFAKMLADGHPKAALAVFRAHLDILKQWSRWWKKRTATQEAATVHNTGCIYPHSLIVAYFLRGKRTFRALNWRADNAH